ncbi:MAG: chlorite dismutase family protein [Chloroflexota bacterium]
MKPEVETVDISEKGRSADGEEISLDRRLYVQVMAFGEVTHTEMLINALAENKIQGALYEDINDPRGVALAAFSDDPDYFLTTLRAFYNEAPFSYLTPKPEYTMLGRTYALGYENDLEDTLIKRPIRRLLDPALQWVVYYPLRRAGSFEQLSAQEQRAILLEHGGIGMAYGRAGLGHDLRLACHGLDKNDNDFLVGLLGPQLAPLSMIVQRMRKTKQTSLHLEKLGPFFIGKVAWQLPADDLGFSIEPSATAVRPKLATL